LRDGITDDSYVVEEFLDMLDVSISLGELQRWDEGMIKNLEMYY